MSQVSDVDLWPSMSHRRKIPKPAMTRSYLIWTIVFTNKSETAVIVELLQSQIHT